MTKKLIIAILSTSLYMGNSTVLAQALNIPYNLNYVPPSASAASLGKFGDIPIGLYTGVPNVSIPIYSYKGINNRLALDINIVYHAGGIRVEEIGGNIGSGWGLNAGGVICRTMRGQPDDLPVYGYIALNPVAVLNSAVPDGGGEPNINIYNEFAQNGYDSEQDEFTFDFGGHSGKFVLDTLGNPVMVDQQDITIQPIPNPGAGGFPFRGFIARDEAGIKYIFTDAETTEIGASSLYETTYSSSWYVTAIVNPFTGDSIKFTYNTALEYYNTFASEQRRNTMVIVGDVEQPAVTAIVDGTQGSTYTILAKKIKSIEFPDDISLIFYYLPGARCDLHGDSILSQIQELDGLTGAKKSFYFDQSYIDQSGHHYPLSPAPCDTSTLSSSTSLRLRLDSVQERAGSLSIPPYVFQYNDTFLLPPRDSKLEDFWGYYNGDHNTAGTLVPFYLWQGNAQGAASYFLDGADRRADSNAVKAGSLIQIKYPTGGTTTFNYEINRAGDDKLIINVPEGGEAGFDFTGDDTTNGETQIAINRSPANEPINFNFEMGSWCPGLPEDATIEFNIMTLDGQMTYATETFAYTDVGTTKTAAGVAIPNGTYQLTFQINGSPGYSCDEAFGFQLEWQYSYADSTQLAGGLRIASTVDFDGIDHKNDVIRQYSYVDSSGKSTGTVGSIMTFGYLYTSTLGGPNTPVTYFVRTATSTTPLSYTQGCSVGYSKVVVNRIGPANNGKEIDYFNSFSDYPNIGATAGIDNVAPTSSPPQTEDWALGLPVRQEFYDGSGNIVKRITKSYTLPSVELDYLPNFKIALVADANAYYNGSPPQYGYVNYNWHSGYSQLSQTKTVDYTTAGDSLVQTINYTYDPVYLKNVTQEIKIDSKGDTVKLYHYYPFDYTIAGSPFSDMVDSNMIAERVSNENWKDLYGSYFITGADATDYERIGTGIFPSNYYVLGASQPEPQQVMGSFNSTQLLRVPSLYYNDISFGYDSKGNPTQINQKGTITNYIWDIYKQFPIAKVENADTASIAYTSFEADGSGNWTIGAGTLDTTTAITGQNSYNLNGTISKSGLNPSVTYIVSYWSENGPYSIVGTISGYPIQGKTETFTNPNWTLYVHKVTGQSTVTLTGNGHIDELRLYPSSAQMTTYTYSPLVGMTSQTDVGNRVTYYEYDGLSRLKRIRDQDYNIIKTFDYQYQTPGGCGSGCTILSMQTFVGTNTPGYPVGVFDMHDSLIGNASGASSFVRLWNSDTADSRIGTLSAGPDSMHFDLSVNTGQSAPAGVLGLRYYQYDIPWTEIDGIENYNGAYVDFGDGTRMQLPRTNSVGDTLYTMALNTIRVGYTSQWDGTYWYIHTYPDSSLKTITIYHNDTAIETGLDNGTRPATSLTRVENLRGNFPQMLQQIGGSCFQQSSANNLAGVTNWNAISSLTGFWAHCGDGQTPCLNMGYAQDFMANNRNLQTINTTNLYLYQAGYWDSTFKLTRLKSDWNTYFTNLGDIEIDDAHWNREDLSGLLHLHEFCLLPDNQNHSNNATNNPTIPIPASVIDNILNQIAAGAGQNVSNGVIWILTGGGTGRTSASSTAVSTLDAEGWLIYIDNVQQ